MSSFFHKIINRSTNSNGDEYNRKKSKEPSELIIKSKRSETNKSNIFINVISIVKNTMITFFLPKNKLSNDAKELIALMICCNDIQDVLGSLYRNHYSYLYSEINERNFNDVRNVWYDGYYKINTMFGKKIGIRQLKAGMLPKNTKMLQFGFEYGLQILSGSLPNTLRKLITGPTFNQPLIKGSLPCSLTCIFLGDRFDQPLEHGSLPESLTEIGFGCFNQPLVSGVLPASLTKLTFGNSFNQPLEYGSLPGSLTEISFGREFNQPLLCGVLPASLTKLTFGMFFDQPIEPKILPCALEHLIFCHDSIFSYSLAGVLPNSLLHLRLGSKYKNLIHTLTCPDSLKCLEICENWWLEPKCIDINNFVTTQKI